VNEACRGGHAGGDDDEGEEVADSDELDVRWSK